MQRASFYSFNSFDSIDLCSWKSVVKWLILYHSVTWIRISVFEGLQEIEWWEYCVGLARDGTSGRLLWKRQRKFGFHKTQGISGVGKELLASQECFCSMQTFRLLRMRTLRWLETSGFDYPVSRRHVSEERNHLVLIILTKVLTDFAVFCGTNVSCYMELSHSAFLFTTVLTETAVNVTNIYQRMSGTRFLWPIMPFFIIAIYIV